jgi:hypothetical protein
MPLFIELLLYNSPKLSLAIKASNLAHHYAKMFTAMVSVYKLNRAIDP